MLECKSPLSTAYPRTRSTTAAQPHDKRPTEVRLLPRPRPARLAQLAEASLLKTGTVGVRISGRARHSPDARADERSFSKREAAGSNPAGASKRTEAIGLPENEPRRVHSSAFSPGYPNQQRTPAQTRCVAGANPVPGTNVTSRTCSVTTVNGEVAGSNPAGRKPVAQWESAKRRARKPCSCRSRGGRRNGALLCKQRVAGSTPALSTIFGDQPCARRTGRLTPLARRSVRRPGSMPSQETAQPWSESRSA